MTQPIAARLLPESGDYEVTFAGVDEGAGILTFDIVPAAEIGPVLQSIKAYLAALAATPPDPAMVQARELAARRRLMVCSPLQGRITLGEAACAQIDALAADPATPFAVRETIKMASEWRRTSATMEALGALLGYSPEAMDALFEQAMTITA